MEYTRTEQYSFSMITEGQAINAFRLAHPGWIESKENNTVVFTKTDTVYHSRRDDK